MASKTYIDCPSCKQDWGMGLVDRRAKLAVECMDCGFRGPEIEPMEDLMERERLAIEAWRQQPRTDLIHWTPAMRLAKIMQGLADA